MSVSLLRRNKFPICSSLSAAAAAAAGRIMRGATWWWSSSTLLIATHQYIYHPSPRFLHISVVDIIVSEAYSSDCHQDIVSRGGGGAGRGAIPADSSHHHRTRSSRHLGWSRPRLNIFYCAEINITSPPSTAQHPALLCCFDLLSLGMYGVGMVNPDSTYFRNQHFWNIYSNILQHWIKIIIISLSFPLIAIFTFLSF